MGVARESRAIRVALANAAGGVLLKLGVGIWSGSLSLISSAVDSAGDLLISLANLWVLRFADQEADEEHNFGHAKIEGFGAMFEGGFIFAGAMFIVAQSVGKLISGDAALPSVAAVWVMPPVLLGTLGTVWYMRKVAAETGSLVLRADSLHYASDVWLNGGVLVSLLLVWASGWWWLDPVVAIAIALQMCRASFHVVRDGFGVLMDEAMPPEHVASVAAAVDAVAGVRGHHDLRTRRGKHPFVDVHVEVDPQMTVAALHDLHLAVRDAVRGAVGAGTVVAVHADPADDAHRAETGRHPEAARGA